MRISFTTAAMASARDTRAVMPFSLAVVALLSACATDRTPGEDFVPPWGKADGSTEHCSGADVVRIERPLFPDLASPPRASESKSQTFQYAFRVLRRSPSPTAPTIVNIPGGPGQTSMELDSTLAHLGE